MTTPPRKLILYFLMAGLIVWATFLTIVARYLNTTVALDQNFIHPFFMPALMVFGEAMCIFIYVYEIKRAKKRYGSYQLHPKVMSARTQGRNTYVNPLHFAVPKLLNLMASAVLAFPHVVSQNDVGAGDSIVIKRTLEQSDSQPESILSRRFSEGAQSAYMTFELSLTLQGCFIFFIVISSLLILKKKPHRYHLICIGIMFVSLLIIIIMQGLVKVDHTQSWNDALSNYSMNPQYNSSLFLNGGRQVSNVFIGIGLISGGLFLFSLQYIYEEWLLNKYFLSPARIMGWQGIWGLLFSAIFLPSFQYLSCNAPFWSNGRVEDTVFAIRQMYDNFLILGLVIAYFIVNAGFALLGVTVMKYTNANTRVALQTIRLVFAWIFFIVFSGNGHQDLNYVQLVGYVILFFTWIAFGEISMRQIDRKDQETVNLWDEEGSMSLSSSFASNYKVNI